MFILYEGADEVRECLEDFVNECSFAEGDDFFSKLSKEEFYDWAEEQIKSNLDMILYSLRGTELDSSIIKTCQDYLFENPDIRLDREHLYDSIIACVIYSLLEEVIDSAYQEYLSNSEEE